MSCFQKLWSDNPNAPKIPPSLYHMEKAYFAGTLIGAVLYGILVALFFQCMAGLLNPVRRRTEEGVRWGLISYTVAMFSFVTVYIATSLNIQSLAFIDNREFPCNPPLAGPLGYQDSIRPKVLGIIPNLMFLLNYLLADGLLLFRCYVIYTENPWVIAFPCLMYLGSTSMGIMMLVGQAWEWNNPQIPISGFFGFPYILISISLNILLTLMIVVRLVLHSRNIRAATGAPSRFSGLYKTIVTMLVECSALYTVISLLVIGTDTANIFLPILAEAQVIAPLLIVQRVANRSALTSETIATVPTISFNLRSRGESIGGALPGGDPMSSVNEYGRKSGELGFRIETTIDLHRDSKV